MEYNCLDAVQGGKGIIDFASGEEAVETGKEALRESGQHCWISSALASPILDLEHPDCKGPDIFTPQNPR